MDKLAQEHKLCVAELLNLKSYIDEYLLNSSKALKAINNYWSNISTNCPSAILAYANFMHSLTYVKENAKIMCSTISKSCNSLHFELEFKNNNTKYAILDDSFSDESIKGMELSTKIGTTSLKQDKFICPEEFSESDQSDCSNASYMLPAKLRLSLSEYEPGTLIHAFITYVEEKLNFYICDTVNCSKYLKQLIELNSITDLKLYQTLPNKEEVFALVIDKTIIRAMIPMTNDIMNVSLF